MKVTEQIDAMEVSAVNPYKFLAATRVVACITMLPLLTLAANFCGILSGWIATTLAEPISLRLFVERGFKKLAFERLTLTPGRNDDERRAFASPGLRSGLLEPIQGRTLPGCFRRGREQ